MSKSFVSVLCLVFIVFSVGVQSLYAQGSGTITGTVVDKASGEELLFTNVQLEGTSLGTSTNELGEFTIHQVPAGDYTLVTTYIGYNQQSIQVSVVAEQTIEVEVELEYAGVLAQEVLVTAQASGQMSAINNQLNSNTIKNVVSADRIRDVPDVNAAESVSRLPGLSLIRNGGEGQKVAIRGVSPQYNVTQVNGVRMQSTDRDDRSVDLNMIAPNILSGIEVTKALTADMDADAVGGTVNLKIGKAAEGFQGKFSLQGGYGSLAETYGNYRATGYLSNRFFNNKFGVQVSGFLDNNNRNSDQVNVGYTLNEEDVLVDGFIPIDLAGVTMRDRVTDRQRTGGSLVFDYQFKNGSLIFNNFISQLDGESLLQQNQFSLNGNQWSGITEQTESKNTVYSNALQGDFDFGFLSMNFSVSNSVSKQKVPHHLQMQFQIAQNAAGFSTPTLENPVESTWNNLLSSAEVIDGPTDRRISRFETLLRDITEEAQEVALNFNVPFSLSQSISGIFKFGGKYVRNFRDNDEEQTFTDPDRNPRGEEFLALAKDSLWTDFGFENIDRNLGIRAFLFEDPDYDVGDWLDGDAGISDFFFKGDIATANEYKELAERAGYYDSEPQESTQRDYTYERKLNAFYASAEVNIGKYVTLFPGIRYEEFDFDYRAFEVLRWGQYYLDFDSEEVKDDEVGGENWFPQLQLRVKPTDWLDVRLAATKSIIYPDYRAVSPYIYINTFQGPSMNLGNPALQPALADNLDAYVSIFDNKLGLFTAGYFYKEIENLIVSSDFRTKDPADINNRYVISNTSQTAVSTWINLEGTSTVKGFELDWQTRLYYLPGFLKGIVLSANYTHLKSETEYPLQTTRKEGSGPFAPTVFIDTTRTGRMPNQPDDIFNFTLGYDIGGFSGRLSYQFTDNILVNTNRTFRELDSFTNSYRRWDFTAYQKLPWLGGGLQAYVNINNITNTPDRSFTSELQLLSGLEYYGRTVDIGLRYSFE
ncbi:MAG: TonB-dependent receptor [Saprospiraceae bacterium]|nr:TonB-dependent receptor [Saprospiraceae bacterium]